MSVGNESFTRANELSSHILETYYSLNNFLTTVNTAFVLQFCKTSVTRPKLDKFIKVFTMCISEQWVVTVQKDSALIISDGNKYNNILTKCFAE